MLIRNFIIRLVINAVALYITASILPGIHIADNEIGTLLVIALVFGIINAFVKPIVKLLTCPLVILTLGLFIFVINALMLMLTAALLPERFMVDGFGSALLGGIVMGVAAILVEWVLKSIGFDEDAD
ncbi:MAG: phage holin family protein [Anaerolineae bacterium]|nr:phage holin family protein [Anaerolineae bacterium]